MPSSKISSRPPFELSDDVRVVLAIMGKKTPGDVLTYGEINAIVKYNIQERRHVLSSAMRVALRDRDEVWAAVTNVGIKLLTNDERAKMGAGALRSIRRAAGRASKKLATVDIKALSKGAREQCVYDRAVLGATQAMVAPNMTKKLAGRSREPKIALAETIEMFKETE
jgi:hypothetical protein